MLSLNQMCKNREKQSFINIRKISLSSPKYKKCIFNKMFKISKGPKHNKSITRDPKKLTGHNKFI